MGVSQNLGYLFGGPYNEDNDILGSAWGPPILGNYHMVEGISRIRSSQALVSGLERHV